MREIVLLTAFLLAWAVQATGAEVEITARLEPDVIGIDETATLIIEVHGNSVSGLTFRPAFELDNLESPGPRSQYEDMRFVNGHLSRTFRLSWQVRPLGLGRGRVHAISVQIRGQVVQLPDCEVRIQRQPTQRRQRQAFKGPDEDPFQQFFGRLQLPRWRREPEPPGVFLRAETDPPWPVTGQQVLYTIYLYTRENIASITPSGVPAFRGFWVQDVPLPQQLPLQMVEIGGQRFGRVPLLQKALFPLRPGRYRIDPATIDLTVQRYDRDFFFTPPVVRPEAVRLSTEPQVINVQPLPPAPPGFAGVVGRVALKAHLEPAQLRLGEAATLTVQLSGTGNLQGVGEPQVSPPQGLTLHPPQQEGRDEVAGTTVKGNRTWSWVVVPGRTGRFQLEAPRVTYFDPEARQFQVATAPAMGLTALPRPADLAADGHGTPGGIRRAALTSPGFPAGRWRDLLPWLFALPWGLALLVNLARRRILPGESLPPAGKTSLCRQVEEGLRQAETETRPRQVAARIEEAWRDFLAARWGVPPSAPSARWNALLAGRGVDGGTLDEMGRIVEDLQYLRFAPQLSTTESLQAEVLSRCRRLLRRLQ